MSKTEVSISIPKLASQCPSHKQHHRLPGYSGQNLGGHLQHCSLSPATPNLSPDTTGSPCSVLLCHHRLPPPSLWRRPPSLTRTPHLEPFRPLVHPARLHAPLPQWHSSRKDTLASKSDPGLPQPLTALRTKGGRPARACVGRVARPLASSVPHPAVPHHRVAATLAFLLFPGRATHICASTSACELPFGLRRRPPSPRPLPAGLVQREEQGADGTSGLASRSFLEESGPRDEAEGPAVRLLTSAMGAETRGLS